MKRYLYMVMVIAVAAGLGLALGGCGGGGGGDPAAAMDEAFSKSSDIKSLHAEFDMQMEINAEAEDVDPEVAKMLPLELKVSGNGDFDNNDPQDPQMKMTLSVSGLDGVAKSLAESAAGPAAAFIDPSMLTDYLSGIEMVQTGGKMYVKLAGDWYDLGSAQQAESYGGDVNCMRDAAAVKLVPSQVFSDIEEVSQEEIDGVSTRHYKAKVNTANLVNALTEMSSQCGQADTTGQLESGTASVEDSVKAADVEAWIDDDGYLRRLKVDMELDTSSLTVMAESLGTTTTQSPG